MANIKRFGIGASCPALMAAASAFVTSAEVYAPIAMKPAWPSASWPKRPIVKFSEATTMIVKQVCSMIVRM